MVDGEGSGWVVLEPGNSLGLCPEQVPHMTPDVRCHLAGPQEGRMKVILEMAWAGLQVRVTHKADVIKKASCCTIRALNRSTLMLRAFDLVWHTLLMTTLRSG